MGSAFVQKLVWSVLGIGVYALAAWPPMAPVAGQLILAAGGMLISPWIPRPGDGELIAAGKEAKRASLKPPPAAGALIVIALLAGCGAQQAVTDARRAAEEMRERSRLEAAKMRGSLASALTMVNIAESAAAIACGFHRVPQCSATEDTISVLRAGVKAADQAVDVVESTGVAMPSVVRQVEGVAAQVEALGATVRALEEEVRHAVDQEGSPVPVVPSGPVGERAAPSEEAASADPGGARP